MVTTANVEFWYEFLLRIEVIPVVENYTIELLKSFEVMELLARWKGVTF